MGSVGSFVRSGSLGRVIVAEKGHKIGREGPQDRERSLSLSCGPFSVYPECIRAVEYLCSCATVQGATQARSYQYSYVHVYLHDGSYRAECVQIDTPPPWKIPIVYVRRISQGVAEESNPLDWTTAELEECGASDHVRQMLGHR